MKNAFQFFHLLRKVELTLIFIFFKIETIANLSGYVKKAAIDYGDSTILLVGRLMELVIFEQSIFTWIVYVYSAIFVKHRFIWLVVLFSYIQDSSKFHSPIQ